MVGEYVERAIDRRKRAALEEASARTQAHLIRPSRLRDAISKRRVESEMLGTMLMQV